MNRLEKLTLNATKEVICSIDRLLRNCDLARSRPPLTLQFIWLKLDIDACFELNGNSEEMMKYLTRNSMYEGVYASS